MPDSRKEVQEEIERAETAAQDKQTVGLSVSRQNYRDLVDAYRVLRQMSPAQKAMGQRLEKLGLQIREALDRANR